MRYGFVLLGLLMSLLVGSASGQTYVGVRGGYGIGNARFVSAKETKNLFGLLSGGVSAKYFSDIKFVGAVQVDLQYFENGFKYDLLKDSDSSYMRTVNTIELPLMWQPHIYIMNRNGRIFMNLGLNLGYNVSSYETYTSKENGVYYEGEYEFKLVRDNRFNYGLVGGIGISVFHKRFEFVAEGRYYYGYSDILKNYTQYPYNPMRSPVDNINVSFGVYYRFGGDIKAAPSKRMSEKLERRTLELQQLENNPKMEEKAEALDSLFIETKELIEGTDTNTPENEEEENQENQYK